MMKGDLRKKRVGIYHSRKKMIEICRIVYFFLTERQLGNLFDFVNFTFQGSANV